LKKTLYQRYCPNLLCQPEANLKAENERLKAWILKIKKYARSISVIVVRYCEDALKEASSVKENQE
jgi:hypothetical protein